MGVVSEGLCRLQVRRPGHLRDRMKALWAGAWSMGMEIVGSYEAIDTGRIVGSGDEFNFFFIVF